MNKIHKRTMWIINNKSGFTLLEMLVVLVIIGMLAGLVGPRMFGRVDESKIKTAKIQIKMLKGCLETMRLDINRFPTESEGLALLFHAPSDKTMKALWKGPYVDEEIPADPWNKPYQYAVPGKDGQPFALYSLGSDGKIAGTGNDADIGYLPLQ